MAIVKRRYHLVTETILIHSPMEERSSRHTKSTLQSIMKIHYIER